MPFVQLSTFQRVRASPLTFIKIAQVHASSFVGSSRGTACCFPYSSKSLLLFAQFVERSTNASGALMVRDTAPSCRVVRGRPRFTRDARATNTTRRFPPHKTSSGGCLACARVEGWPTSHIIPAAPSAPEVMQNHAPRERRGRRECRVFDAPAASRAVEESTRVSHHRFTETFRHSLHDGFTVSSALSSETRRSCLRRLRMVSQA